VDGRDRGWRRNYCRPSVWNRIESWIELKFVDFRRTGFSTVVGYRTDADILDGFNTFPFVRDR